MKKCEYCKKKITQEIVTVKESLESGEKGAPVACLPMKGGTVYYCNISCACATG